MNKKQLSTIVMLTVCILLSATFAYAGTWDTFKDSVGMQVIAYMASGVLLIGGVQKYTNIISTVLIAVGTLCITVGTALLDSKLTRDEIKEMVAGFKDILAAIKSGKKVN